jgi:hypothetical protein
VLQALEKLPADRFASAAKFSAALAGSPSAAGAGSRKFTAAHRPQARPASRPPVLLAGAVRVSLEGGTEPIWGRDGRSLYFRGPIGAHGAVRTDGTEVWPIARTCPSLFPVPLATIRRRSAGCECWPTGSISRGRRGREL